MNAMTLVKSDMELRELLNPSAPATLEKSTILKHSTALVETILNTNTIQSYEQTKTQLSRLYEGLKDIFEIAQIPVELRKRQFLNKTGLAISPQHALTTIKDVFRVSGFIRSIDQAIEDLKQAFPEKLHIVYPACGPLAPLLMPLLAYYKHSGKYGPEDLSVTLIEIQEGAVLSLQTLFQASELDCYIKDIVYCDAVDYVKKADEKIHLVILEAMQHGFSKEGQLAIAIHFSKLLDVKGIFLPQKIAIEGVLASGEIEFNRQWKEQGFTHASSMDKDIIKDRIKLGKILEITPENIKNMDIFAVDEYTKLVRCASLKIPEMEKDRDQKILLFCSKIEIYKGEVIDEYDSGITHPLPDLSICINFIPTKDKKPEDLCVNSGDTLAFFYRMNGLPGFLVTKKA